MVSEEDDGANDLEAPVPEGLPEPLTWRVLVMPIRPKKVSKGGIVIAEESQRNQSVLDYRGRIVAAGPIAFHKTDKSGEPIWPEGSKPKVGDFVVYGRYAGQPLEHRGAKLLIVNDDEILARVKDPESLRVYL